MLTTLAVLHEKHVLAVLAPVPADLPEALVVHEGRLHFLVAIAQAKRAHRVRQNVEEQRAFVRPEDRAGRERMEMEEVQLLAELAVVPLARFFLLLEPGVQVLLVEERRPVDALQLRVPVIASPVRAGDVEQLDDADLSSRGRVRARRGTDTGGLAFARNRNRLV